MLTQVIAIARLEHPACARVAMHPEERRYDARDRPLEMLIGHAVQRKPALEVRLARANGGLVVATQIETLQLGVHENAHPACRLPRPVKYHRLLPCRRGE